MKLYDMLARLGFDLNREYSEEIINVPVSVPTGNQSNDTNNMPAADSDSTNVQTVDNSAVEQYKTLIEQQQAQIAQLQLANKQLIQQTPINEPELSIEDMIYRSVIGNSKEVNK